MSRLFSISLSEIKGWIFSPRAILGILVGCVLYIQPTIRYVDLVSALGEKGNAVEPFIIFASNPQIFTFSLLGLLLLLSNAPFFNEQTPYVILRASKMTWIKAQILYITLSAVIYYLILFTVTSLVALRSCHFDSQWSNPFLLLSRQAPQYLVSKYQLSFSFPEFASRCSPIGAVFSALAYNSLYGMLLALCLLTFNLWGKGQWGWVMCVIAHISGYLVMMNGPMVFSPKLSLMMYAMPALHHLGFPYQHGSESAIILIGINAMLILACTLRVKNHDVRGM